ncbi:MAG: pyridoxamine 5'-phosphate oxidase family protein [Waddliaceae bacterium]
MKIVQKDFEIENVLTKPLMAHLASSHEGVPRGSPLWFLYEDQKIWLFGIDTDSFIKRLQLEPRCALTIVDFDLDRGVLRHVGVRGKSTVTPVNSVRLKRFVRKYLGNDVEKWNQWFVTNIVDTLNQMVQVDLETVVAKDVSFFKTGPHLVEND